MMILFHFYFYIVECLLEARILNANYVLLKLTAISSTGCLEPLPGRIGHKAVMYV